MAPWSAAAGLDLDAPAGAEGIEVGRGPGDTTVALARARFGARDDGISVLAEPLVAVGRRPGDRPGALRRRPG